MSFVQFVAVGALIFGVFPLGFGALMRSGSSGLNLVNKIALVTALASIIMGVLFALATINGRAGYTQALLSCVALFVGSAATLCTIKFFYANRDSDS